MKLSTLIKKLNLLTEQYQNLNRIDFSGSWESRIRSNTGPQFGDTELYNKNVEKQLKEMRKYNERTKKRITELKQSIQNI